MLPPLASSKVTSGEHLKAFATFLLTSTLLCNYKLNSLPCRARFSLVTPLGTVGINFFSTTTHTLLALAFLKAGVVANFFLAGAAPGSNSDLGFLYDVGQFASLYISWSHNFAKGSLGTTIASSRLWALKSKR